MALKDWEKGKTSFGKTAFYNKKNSDTIVLSKGKSFWNVQFGKIGKRDYKFFKTKSKALAYARNYMRKH